MNNEADIIRDQMALVRQHLDADVADVVESVHGLVDWRGYVRRYPLATLGAAAAVGFALVPTRRQVFKPSADDVAGLIQKKRIVVSDRAAKPGMLSTLVTLAATTMLRSALTNAGAKASQLMASANSKSRDLHEAEPNDGDQLQS